MSFYTTKKYVEISPEPVEVVFNLILMEISPEFDAEIIEIFKIKEIVNKFV